MNINDLEKYYTVCSSGEESKYIAKLLKAAKFKYHNTGLAFTDRWNIVVFNSDNWETNYDESLGKEKMDIKEFIRILKNEDSIYEIY